MAKNLIPEICKMLGVELGEEFKIKGFNGVTYRFANDGLRLTPDDGPRKFDTTANMALIDLLSGVAEIVKLPWKPKKGDTCYTFYLLNGKWVVHLLWCCGSPNEYALLEKGWIYRTCAEAEAALPKVAKEMGVEYEL